MRDGITGKRGKSSCEEEDDSGLAATQAQAVQDPFAGFYPERDEEQLQRIKPRLCANVDGFSLHADTTVSAEDREARLRLCRYGARQSFSQKNLSLLLDRRSMSPSLLSRFDLPPSLLVRGAP